MAEKYYDHRRFCPAPDDELRALFRETKEWLTSHGHVFMNGEIYGLPIVATDNDEDNWAPDTVMYGTAPIGYEAQVGSATLGRWTPRAARLLGLNRGVDVMYDESYYQLGINDELVYTSAEVSFFASKPVNNTCELTTYNVVLERGRHVAGYFLKYGLDGPDYERRLARQECGLLRAVMEGLGTLARRHPYRRRVNW